MNRKLPKIYKESNSKKINNNKTVFYSDNSFNNTDNKETFNLEEEYVFNTPVIIETVDEILKTKIVGKVKDHILTSNNKVIKLNEIKKISLLN